MKQQRQGRIGQSDASTPWRRALSASNVSKRLLLPSTSSSTLPRCHHKIKQANEASSADLRHLIRPFSSRWTSARQVLSVSLLSALILFLLAPPSSCPLLLPPPLLPHSPLTMAFTRPPSPPPAACPMSMFRSSTDPCFTLASQLSLPLAIVFHTLSANMTCSSLTHKRASAARLSSLSSTHSVCQQFSFCLSCFPSCATRSRPPVLPAFAPASLPRRSIK